MPRGTNILGVQSLTIHHKLGLPRGIGGRLVIPKYCIELREEHGKDGRRYVKSRGKHDPDVAHRHLVHICVVDDDNQELRQGFEEIEIRSGKSSDQNMERHNLLLPIIQI